MAQHKAKEKPKFLVFILTVILVLSYMRPIFGQEGDDRTVLTPTDAQFLEMRATEIKQLPDGTKQLIIELRGHEMVFKRI